MRDRCAHLNPGAGVTRRASVFTRRPTSTNSRTHMHAHSRLLLASIACGATLACGSDSPTEAPTHVGTYILQTAAGQPAPAVIHSLVVDATGKPVNVLV